ncbi:uncharacterized protein LOC121624787 [Chelmon rostratus]|uniref:uncharacterized protein LOC121624787 n=1 Tax=Chelmon rostratus TaxID=109905 RepID=UPI001BE598F8|nr:uncharacterized protein LOC121624787 [Chelmon rostratus]
MAPSSFVWTDSETELLLNTILEYKLQKTQENIDWDSCQSKYLDILALFLEHYPAESSNDFPHERGELTRSILTTKIKAVRSKYRLAVDNGRRSGFGRVVLLYFELCEQIWGGSPATTTMSSGIETNDLNDGPPVPSPTESSSTVDPSDTTSDTEQESSVASVKERRHLLQERLNGHRHSRLRRKLPAENQWLNAVEEDQRVKKRLVEFLETSEKQASDNFARLSETLNMLTTTVSEGFSVLRQVIQPPPPQPSHYMPYGVRGHMSHSPYTQSAHPNQAFQSLSNNPPLVRGTQQNAGSTQDAAHASTTADTRLTGFSYTQALFSDEY